MQGALLLQLQSDLKFMSGLRHSFAKQQPEASSRFPSCRMPEMTPRSPFEWENRQRGEDAAGDVQFLSITHRETPALRSVALSPSSQKRSYQEGGGETLVGSGLGPVCDWLNSSQLPAKQKARCFHF